MICITANVVKRRYCIRWFSFGDFAFLLLFSHSSGSLFPVSAGETTTTYTTILVLHMRFDRFIAHTGEKNFSTVSVPLDT